MQTATDPSRPLPTTVTLSADALFQEIDGEAVILDLASSSYFGLDGVGVRLWQLLQADSSLQAACDQLLEEYEVGKAQLEQDINNLINQLAESNLVSLG